ncbi:amino acid/amide ABC transporter substrate-binding protein, HAAT family [Pseudonocardia thermophila]|jgi:ABC-type branched-chain amino acid transport systems, periplasmic component|uniref:Amino acid/amide ABC transporter substrate-binding protein, HAAT family n=1 Tax=Pseudonocardia thermophila TaxID=1848 RepID=A0A1M6XK01_PSETH|nr:ABC transporter substrate-binding protein [Pseudonocardia thermophila]SHL06243.1 amino acid/amide ABC transporter substrate-binding protein, HAAT family [Pseudonocardia thermophila]
MLRGGRAAVVLAAALALTACGGGGEPGGGEPGGGVYRIGVVTSSTGPFAANHTTMVAGAEYAVKVLNENGGINGNKVELVTVDGQNNPTSLATLIPQLATRDQVYAIVGPVDSAGCEIACATANKLEVPIVSPGAGRPGVLANSRPYGFTLAQPDAANSTAVLSKAIRDLGFTTAAIITDEANATTKAQADLFTQIFADTGVQVVQRATFASGDSSFASQITSIAAADPDVLALAAGPDDAGRIAREARSQKLRATFLGTGALQSGGSAYVAAGGEATEGTIAAAQYDPHSSNPVAAPLLEKAQADTGQADIPLNFAYAFDAVNMVATLIKEKNLAPDGTDIANARRQIQEGLNAMDRYVGMADVTTFAEDGTAERPQLRSVVQGGKFVIDKSAS